MLHFHLTEDLSHLIHVQFAGEYHHISKLGVELQRLDIRDVQLRREVYLLPYLITIGHHCHVRGNHC